MTSKEIYYIGGAANALIARAKARRFPGVLVQGDTLRNLLSLVEGIRDSALEPLEVRDLCEEMGDILLGMLSVYESVLAEKGLELPYSVSVVRGGE